ncbi:MAG: hypothetical protein GY933_04175, partial [Hyphomicrobiales bacterium]|nr:hypothetical protein [Hyphomicrobiales bacterium]
NHNLGGPGNTWANLTPLTQKANQDHHADFESRVKRAVNEEYRILKFTGTANYGRQSRETLAAQYESYGNPNDLRIAEILRAERTVPLTLTMEATEIKSDGTNQENGLHIGPLNVANGIEEDPEKYQIRVAPSVYLSEMSKSAIASQFGLSEDIAKRIAARDRYTSWSQVAAVKGVGQATADAIRNKQGLRVRLYKRS